MKTFFSFITGLFVGALGISILLIITEDSLEFIKDAKKATGMD